MADNNIDLTSEVPQDAKRVENKDFSPVNDNSTDQSSVDTVKKAELIPDHHSNRRHLDTSHGSPRRGPTLSTSTSSFEALDPHDPNLSHLASLMFSHTSNYLQGELSAVSEDYTLLEQMNRATIAKYTDLRKVTSSVDRSLDELNLKYLGLQPYLDQIDQIEDSVTKLEAAAYKLDAYARRLEDKFKCLERK